MLVAICRMVNGLLKTAQGVHPGAATILSPVQDATFKLEAIKCLVGICRSMGVWMNRQLHVPDSQLPRTSAADDQNPDMARTSPANGTVEDAVNGIHLHGEINKDISEAATFEQRRAYKVELQVSDFIFFVLSIHLMALLLCCVKYLLIAQRSHQMVQ